MILRYFILNVLLTTMVTTATVVIRCPIKNVFNADPPAGTCTNPDLVYRTECSYQCRAGYSLKGSNIITCQLDKSWSPAAPTCEQVTCPALPKVAVGVYIPAMCDDVGSPYPTTCQLRCPAGYHISNLPTNIVTDTRTCQIDGTWEHRASTPTCKDFQPPTLSCPGSTTVDNDKGKGVATVNWNFAFTDNSLMANEPGITMDSFTVVLTINDKNVDTILPKMIGIGIHAVKYVVTDAAGKSSSCSFYVTVRDTEPPVITDCPNDIMYDDITTPEKRIDWQRPTATDNSGLPPIISSNRQSGSLLSVPGSYEVLYTVSDGVNDAKTCSFRITLKRKTCEKYPAPKNGALACFNNNGNDVCAVMCQSTLDFVHSPPLIYFCSNAEWQFHSVGPYDPQLPWPDCSGQVESSSWIKASGLNYFFNGTDPNVRDTIRKQFIDLMKAPYVPPTFCLINPQCTKENTKVCVGESTA